jgi:hypothetical protein
MNKTTQLWIYRITTGLLTVLMVFSAYLYLFQHEMAAENFTRLGLPTFIIYPLAICKILGLVAIWTNKSKMLKEWAYAGYTMQLSLAVGTHLSQGDSEFVTPLVALLWVIASYVTYRMMTPVYIDEK